MLREERRRDGGLEKWGEMDWRILDEVSLTI